MINEEYINVRVKRSDRDRLARYVLFGETLADAVTRVLDKVEEKSGDREIIASNIERLAIKPHKSGDKGHG